MEKNTYVGMIVITAILVIIGTSLFANTVSNEVGKMSNTFTITNQSITLGTNGTWVDLTGQNLIGSMTVNNNTHSGSAVSVESREAVSSSTGTLRVQIRATNATWANKAVNVTYTYGAEGYVGNAAGRGIVLLIALGFALLIMVIALSPVARSGIMELIRG